MPLPAIEFKGSSLRLGTMRFELRNIALQLGSKPSLGVTVAIGLPSELNKLFGTKADGTASVNVFRTYQPGLPDSLIGLSLKLDSNGLLAQILSPPLTCITGQAQSLSVLATIHQLTTRLPECLRSYLSFEIRSLSFDLSSDAAGNVSLNIATPKDAPLRCLLPGFPFITGITGKPRQA